MVKAANTGLLVLGALVAIALLFVPTTPRNGPLREIYDRIRVGMSPDELFDIRMTALAAHGSRPASASRIAKAQYEEGRALFRLLVTQYKAWTAGENETEQIRVYFDDNLRVRTNQYRSGIMLRVTGWFDDLLQKL